MDTTQLQLGPLQPLLNDDSITEIMVNTFNRIFVEKEGQILVTNLQFASEAELVSTISTIAKYSGREINAEKPFLDGHLPDGSRVNAVISPMAPDGANLTVRKFRQIPFSIQDLLESGALDDKVAYFIHASVRSRLNIVVSGGTGTGKTTFLNMLSCFIPESERVITIEDVAELHLQHPNWIRLESVYGPGGTLVTVRDCLINSLRMRPDRIIVGECRRDETFEMLQAMNTGHDGSMTTIHANTPRDCLSRMESLITTSNVDYPLPALRRQIVSAINIVIQLKRLKTGQRVVQEIIELTGTEQNTITSQIIFSRNNKSNAEHGALTSSGLVPTFMDRFAESGIQFPPNFFDQNTKITYRPD